MVEADDANANVNSASRWGTARRWAAGLLGVALGVSGALLIARPLTSVTLLGIYVGVSCLASGGAELLVTRSPRWWDRLVTVLWLVAGAIVLVFLEASLTLLPLVIALTLWAAGVVSLASVARTEGGGARALTLAWGSAQMFLGLLAFAWPDVTLVLAGVWFAARMAVFGLLLVRGAVARGAVRVTPTATASSGAAGTRNANWANRLRWLGAAGVVVSAVALVVVSVTLRSGAVEVDAFYDPPAQVPEEPGQLLRAEDFAGTIPDGGWVKRILYTTTDAKGEPAIASALVVGPEGPSDLPHPVIAWNHGTTGIARHCAPSLMDISATSEAIPGVDDALDAGWVVVASDYAGQGTPGTFPYLIGEGQARSTLDGVRAARQLDDLDLADQTVVWGHSQGGHAALWTARLAGSYAPELHLVGTAAISPAADPRALAERLLESEASGLLSVAIAWVLLPYSETYDDVELEELVSLPGRPLIREMAGRCTTEPALLISVLEGLAVSRDRPLYRADLTSGTIGERLAENTTHGPFDQPLLVAWGDHDEVIPPDLQEAYVSELCAAQVSVVWEVHDADHVGMVRPKSPFLAELLRWTADAFEGEAPGSSCPG